MISAGLFFWRKNIYAALNWWLAIFVNMHLSAKNIIGPRKRGLEPWFVLKTHYHSILVDKSCHCPKPKWSHCHYRRSYFPIIVYSTPGPVSCIDLYLPYSLSPRPNMVWHILTWFSDKGRWCQMGAAAAAAASWQQLRRLFFRRRSGCFKPFHQNPDDVFSSSGFYPPCCQASSIVNQVIVDQDPPASTVLVVLDCTTDGAASRGSDWHRIGTSGQPPFTAFVAASFWQGIVEG